MAVDRVEQLIEDFDAETEWLIFEARHRKELISNIAVNLLRRSEQRSRASLRIPETPRRDPNPLIKGNIEPVP